MAEKSLKGNILVLTQWSFKDALVQTYTLPYVFIIRKIVSRDRKIVLITSEQEKIALQTQEIDTINKEWENENMQLLALPYRKFGLIKMIGMAGQLFKLIRLIRKEKIKVIHAFCTPAGGLGYILSKLTGTKLVIDSYEPHAEAMVENGTWGKNSFAFKILYALEKKQSNSASAIIGTTEGMKNYALEKYGVKIVNFFVKPACVDLEKFKPEEKNIELLKELDLENKIVCVYAGKLGGIYLKEEVFDFIKACYDYFNDKFRVLMLTNTPENEIITAAEKAQIPKHVVISKFVFHHEIPMYLSLGDFAINPVKSVPTKRFCTSIKDGEYWAMGLPVIISENISDDSGIIMAEQIGIVTNFTDKEGLPVIVEKIDKLLDNKEDLKTRIRNIAVRYRSFTIAENIYNRIY